MLRAKQWGLAAVVLLLSITCCCLVQPAAAQRRQLTQASWKSQFLSLAVTVEGPCTAAGYPTDVGVTFADCARKDAERLANVVVARVIRNGVQGAGSGACLTRKVNNQTLAGLGVLLRLRGPDVITEDAQLLVAAGSKRGPIGGFVCNVFPTTCLFIKELGASILANNATYGANPNFAMALPGKLPPPPSPVPGEDRAVLKFEDFKYQGAFAIPAMIPECNTHISWSSGGLALQVRDGVPYFYSTANRSDGATLYEFTYSGKPSLNINSMPLAHITWCGDGYGEGRTLTPGSQSNSFLLTHGLHYSEKMGRLYWTFGEEHLSSTDNAYFLGYAKPSTIKRSAAPATAAAAAAGDGSVEAAGAEPKAATGNMAAAGPWRIAAVQSGGTTLHSQKVRGGAMEIPQWFANKYLGGRSLGVGFGGYYEDAMAGMSMGPSLVAVQHPANGIATGTLSGPMELLGYGFGPEDIEKKYCRRNADYAVDMQEFPWSKNPPDRNRSSPGFWAPGDSIEGAAAWVDNGTHHGLLFFPELSQGYIGVAEDAQTLERVWSLSHWYIYDPAELAAVALGNKDPWEVQPAQWQNITYLANVGRGVDAPTGQFRRVTGAAYDSTTQTLYVLYVHSGREIAEDYNKPFHMVHVFQLGGAPTNRRAAAAAAQSDAHTLDMQAAAAAVPEDQLAQDEQQQQDAAAGDAAAAAAAAAAATQQPLRLRRHLL